LEATKHLTERAQKASSHTSFLTSLNYFVAQDLKILPNLSQFHVESKKKSVPLTTLTLLRHDPKLVEEQISIQSRFVKLSCQIAHFRTEKFINLTQNPSKSIIRIYIVFFSEIVKFTILNSQTYEFTSV
jgi:hypothetical protein